jgi:hypothetical protein
VKRTTKASALTPEALAHAAVAKAVHEIAPLDRVRLPLTVSLKTADAERLTALAIERSVNLDALVTTILERHLRSTSTTRTHTAHGRRRPRG